MRMMHGQPNLHGSITFPPRRKRYKQVTFVDPRSVRQDDEGEIVISQVTIRDEITEHTIDEYLRRGE